MPPFSAPVQDVEVTGGLSSVFKSSIQDFPTLYAVRGSAVLNCRSARLALAARSTSTYASISWQRSVLVRKFFKLYSSNPNYSELLSNTCYRPAGIAVLAVQVS